MPRVAHRKSPTVYYLILGLWAIVVASALPAMLGTVAGGVRAGSFVAVLAIASALFIAYFWLNGVKDIVYTLYYHLRLKGSSSGVPRRTSTEQPRVVMVYCTYDDFSGDSLSRSAAQDYDNVEVVILDDSTKPEYTARVDEFAAQHGIRVVRREGRLGFKAGNLNNFLRSAEYDYFVILDSDEVTPPSFIDRALDYFADRPDVGIVQANHVATRNRNDFMRTFAAGVDSHWVAYQSVKDRFGFLSLLGHGAMVSRACYEAVDGFPHVVAEDLCFSIAARDAGYVAAFAADIVCEEEYPVDYLSFKKRHSKWTQGNMEFIKRYTGTILRSRMTWFEKLDIVLFTYSLPLTALFSLYVVMHVVVLPAMGQTLIYPAWMVFPTLAFLAAPMLNDVLFYYRSMKTRRLVRYLLYTMLLYGSMLFISLRSSLTSAFGKSTFLVTPKEVARVSLGEALRANAGELVFAIGLAAVAMALTGSLLPVFLMVVPALSTAYLAVLHQRRSCPEDEPDEEPFTTAEMPERSVESVRAPEAA